MDGSRRALLCESLRPRFTEWQRLAAELGTPLLVLNPDDAVAQYRLLARRLTGFRLHYAVKALPHPAVLTGLAAAGCGFDAATTAEVDLVRSLGIPMSRCIHTHPVKKPRDIDHAYRAGMRTFVVDSPGEAQKFHGRPADIDVLVRLAYPNPTAKSDLSAKFGADPGDAELVVKHVISAGVRFAGFSFHVGSQGSSVQPFRTALESTVRLSDRLRRTLGVTTRVIDIGGGFPVTYREPMPPIEAIADVVDDVLRGDRDRFTLLAEPGRFLAAGAMTLLTSVVGTSNRDGRVWHYLDDGLYGSYSNVMTEDVHPPILTLNELGQPASGGPFERVTLAGPTCDSADVVARDYPMPPLTAGDIVVSPMMGAYTTVTSSRFNGIAATPVVVSRP